MSELEGVLIVGFCVMTGICLALLALLKYTLSQWQKSVDLLTKGTK